MTAALTSVYTGLAKRFNVATCDLLLLENFEVRTCEDLYYKFPEEADLRAFLMEEMRQQVGEKDAADAIVLVPRDVVLEEAAFNRSDTAKSMRKLWSASRQQARKDMDRLTDELTEDRPQTKVNPMLIESYFEEGRTRGLDDSDPLKKPGEWCMSRVIINYMPLRGRFEHMEVEEFVCEEDEASARLHGLQPKVGFKLVRNTSGGLDGQEEIQYLVRNDVTNILELQDQLGLREFAHDIGKACDTATFQLYHGEGIKALRLKCPPGFRPCSILEWKKFDRYVMRDINSQLKRGRGTMVEGLTWFLEGNGRNNVIWELLKMKQVGTPDMGMERPVQSLETRLVTPGQAALSTSSQSRASTDKRGRSPSRKRSRSPRRRSPARQPNGKLKSVPKGCCNWCGEPRVNHEGNDFDSCNRRNMSKADFEQMLANRTRSPAKGKGKGKAKSKDKDRGKAPALGPHWSNCARRTQISKKEPEGRRYCFDYHDKGSCSKDRCQYSHTCPKFLEGGGVCGENHPLCDNHGNRR